MAMEEVEWEACLLEPRRDAELEALLRSKLGRVPPGVEYYMSVPWVARTYAHFDHMHGGLAHTPFRLFELIALVVSRDNSCRFCFAAVRTFMRIQGFPEAQIRRIEQDLMTAELDPRTRLAVELARAVSRGNPAPTGAELKRLLDAGYSREAILEIVALAGFWVAANRMSTLPALPPGPLERLPDRWPVRLLRPLLARRLLGGRSPGRPTQLTPAERVGPFAYLINAFDGLPIARSSRAVLNEAWESPVLTRRTKALVCAVVARGLGETHAEAEARRLLEEEGLGRSDVDEVLDHLASPKLDAVEAELVPLARETIRFRPAPLQRRLREFRERFGEERLLEFVGIAAMANDFGRMSLVLDEV